MNSRRRRVREIELTLTPQQIVVMWLRNALQAGTFEEGARHSPPYRGVVADAVLRTVQNSMKGQPEPLIERAVLQARREADELYQLAVKANVEVAQKRSHREREYTFLLGYLSAEMHGNATKERVERLRRAIEMFIETVIILDAAIVQIAAERLNGEPVLFRDTAAQLEEQLEMAARLSENFNSLAGTLGVADINLGELRSTFQSEINRQVSIWINLARVEALGTFGTEEEMHAAMDRYSLLFRSKSGKSSDAV